MVLVSERSEKNEIHLKKDSFSSVFLRMFFIFGLLLSFQLMFIPKTAETEEQKKIKPNKILMFI